jgi:hypothetical protein
VPGARDDAQHGAQQAAAPTVSTIASAGAANCRHDRLACAACGNSNSTRGAIARSGTAGSRMPTDHVGGELAAFREHLQDQRGG